jgi:response regulator of citrate/malate metabolism
MGETKVLLIERKIAVSSFLPSLIHKLGYSLVAWVDNGKTALELIQKTKPDLLLVSTQLEGEWDGIQTVEQIQHLIYIPVIYISHQKDRNTLERAKKTNPVDYLLQPLRDKELEIALEFATFKKV